jgi:D-glycero-alpha-D-manno-heptose 1-phosphate guanylyltransferase
MGTSEALAIVLAGGAGTRIAHLHPEVPKPMIPVAGKPFLYWVLEHLRAQGITRAVLSTGHLAHVIEEWVATSPIAGMHLLTAREERPLGTAGGFLHAIDAVGVPRGEVVVLNGDSLVVAPLGGVLAAVRAGAAAAILGVEVEDAARFGTLEKDARGRLVAFREKRPGPAVINAGVYTFACATIAALPRKAPLSFELDVFPSLLARGAAIEVVEVTAPFLDIGVPASLAEAEGFVRTHSGSPRRA